MLRAALALRPFGIVQEAPHSLQAGGVEGFEDVEGGEEERAGAAGGVEDRYVTHGVPEGAQELRPLALGDDVPERNRSMSRLSVMRSLISCTSPDASLAWTS